jgi:hypothetical protein
LAWCYQRAFARLWGTGSVPCEYPDRLGSADAQEAAVKMMYELDAGGRMSDRSRDFQTAFLEIQYAAPFDECRPISALHYLYCLATALGHRRHIVDLQRELPELLRDGSATLKMANDYQAVAELSKFVVPRCRQMVFESGLRERLEETLPTR